MTISLGGTNYDAAELIKAIQESNDAEHQQALVALNEQVAGLQAAVAERDAAVATLTAKVAELEAANVGATENGNLLQAILVRLAAVEGQLPITRAGYGVTTTVQDGYTRYRVQTMDEVGRRIFTTFEVPLD